MAIERRDDGFVAIEWVLAIATLLLPVVALVATLPHWAERRHTATVAAREAATALAQSLSVDSAQRRADAILVNHGIDADDVDVVITGDRVRRGYVEIAVKVSMPALALPGLDQITWSYTARQHQRIDDYRSLP